MRHTIRVVLYLRCSDKKQDKSIDQQRQACHAYVKRVGGMKIVAEFVDDGISGDATEKRVSFLRMIDRGCRGEFDAILCWDQDRFGRFDGLEAGFWIHPLRQAGIRLLTVEDGEVQWNNFTGRMMYTLKQEAKHQYLVDLSKNVLRGQIDAANNGSWIGCAPFGYVITGTKGNKRLELDSPDKRRIIIRIFREYVQEDRSMREIANRLNADGFLSPGGREWRFDAVKVILQNPAYIGRFRFNVYSRGEYHFFSNGKTVKGTAPGRRDPSDWIVKEDHHPVIVERSLFDRAQAKLAKGKTGQSPYTSENNPYLFTGKLKCSKCGATLSGYNNGKFRYYECGKRKYDGEKGCEGTTVREDRVIDWLSDYLHDTLSFGGEIDLKRLEKAAKRDEIKSEELPRSFVKLKRMFVKEMAPSIDLKQIERMTKAIDVDIGKAERNLRFVDPEFVPGIQNAIHALREERNELKRELANQPSTQNINDTVVSVLRSLYWFSKKDRDSVKAAVREIDSIVCTTDRTGVGTGNRHTLRDVYVRFVAGVTGKSNPHPAG